jgi:hypothetical protein
MMVFAGLGGILKRGRLETFAISNDGRLSQKSPECCQSAVIGPLETTSLLLRSEELFEILFQRSPAGDNRATPMARQARSRVRIHLVDRFNRTTTGQSASVDSTSARLHCVR